MEQRMDLTNMKFGYWLVQYYAGDKKWHCKCTYNDCNVERDVSQDSLVQGKSKSCGKHRDINKKSVASFIDITDMQFNELKALKYLGDRKWLCQCSCGKQVIKDSRKLRNGSSKSCGHDKINPRFQDLTNKQFNEWEVIKYLGNSFWECKCSCGKISKVKAYELTSGRSKSCGHTVQQLKDKYNNKAGDWEVISKDGGTVTCKCVCGITKTFSDSTLWYYRKNNFKCNHTQLFNKKFGMLEVIETLPDRKCRCKCDCGNETITYMGNLISGQTKSCGCIRAQNMYSKEQVIKVIKEFSKQNGYSPFAKDIANMLNIGMTTAYGYIEQYDLYKYISRYSSIAESEIASLFNNTIQHDRTILNGKELDIYIPEKKLAIEFNGNYWHSTICKDKYYHQQKTIDCAKQGIRLIHIFEYEWTNKKELIKEYLNNIADLDMHKIYARNCIIKEIDSSTAKEFEEQYHLQGSALANINIALYNEEEMVGLMTFGTPRFSKEYQYELIRLCFKTNIIGGTQKLFKYFIRNYNPTSIITYCNIAKFTGNIYTKLEFKPIQPNPITKPNYVWVDVHNKEVLTRYQTQKQKLVSKGVGTQDQTEDEIMMNLNYYKVYDSGNLKLEWKVGE